MNKLYWCLHMHFSEVTRLLFPHQCDSEPVYILSYHLSALSSHCTTQTHRNYLCHRLTITRWFSWEQTGQQSSPARWLHQRLKWLCTASFHPWRSQWTGRRSPLMSRRASPSIDHGLIMLEPCTVWPVWATWGRAPPSTCSSMLTVSAAIKLSLNRPTICWLQLF